METTLSGKVEFTHETKMHLDVCEPNANMKHITKEVRQRLEEQYVIVTSDGLELEDCEGTQGEHAEIYLVSLS